MIAPAGAPIGCTCDWHDVSGRDDAPRSKWLLGLMSQSCPLHGWPVQQPIRALLTDTLAVLEACGARECYLGVRWRNCSTSAVCDRLARLAERIEAVLDGSGSIQVP